MDERQVKAATLARLREEYGRRRKPIVTAEFSLGSSGIRADLVVFANETIGFEIKTARDTLRRLPSQMHAYARYFNHAVAIVAPCHLPNLIADDLCGASVWTYDGEGVLSVFRTGIANVVDDAALDDLLTQAERRTCDFRAAMKARYAATSSQFWRAVSRRSIRPDDLPLLSRFADNRAQARRFAEERDNRWSHWLAAQGCLETA
ncbi:sce7726 family protein [Magnetospirillum sulfuroxidans]|uniref:Sce7726 family protein n=1 Tax=Magnetospirillum sulfuroxidans TaxID=611300 RepID=A0ABS5IED3_9PROT|nr:sce7726 family protein [Magnetospirillum sulfuroxidans]MBR9972694.1 sce7726 family protein [Magnetospirillum sulfuroxidans]